MAEILRRDLTAVTFEGATCLSMTETDDGQIATFLSGADATQMAKTIADAGGTLRLAGGGFLARVPAGLPAAHDETALFEKRRTILALRPGRSPEVAADWIRYHARLGVTGILIFAEGGMGAGNALADALGDLEIPGVRVMIVTASVALFEGEALREDVLLETLRHRFLSRAEVVACLDVGDVLLPSAQDVFVRATEAGMWKYIQLRGRVAFAEGGGVAVADHIYVPRLAEKAPMRWCVSPALLTRNAVWRESWIDGGAKRSPTGEFLRAEGVRGAGAGLPPPDALIEDRAVSRELSVLFGREPKRRPRLRPPPARAPVTIVTTMKNEGPYIVDWLAHHRVVGIEQVLVYTNDCEDGTDTLLDALATEGVVSRRENPYRETNGAPQRAAFRAARDEAMVKASPWLLPLDVDEYLTIHVGAGRMTDLFDAAPEATVFSVPWRLFGSSDVVGFQDVPVTEQFRLGAPDYAPRPIQAWGFKSLFLNDGTFRQIGVHKPRRPEPARSSDVVWINGSGHPFPESEWEGAWRDTPSSWGYGLAQINHYAVRSADAFLVKRARGRTNHVGEVQGLSYWFRMNFNGPEERSIDRYAGEVAAERARLMALPRVAEAHARAVAWHRAKIATLKEDPEYLALWQEITGARLRALSRRLPHFGNQVFFLGPDVIPEGYETRKIGGDWLFTVPMPKAE